MLVESWTGGGRSWGVVVIYEPVTSRHLRHQTNRWFMPGAESDSPRQR